MANLATGGQMFFNAFDIEGIRKDWQDMLRDVATGAPAAGGALRGLANDAGDLTGAMAGAKRTVGEVMSDFYNRAGQAEQRALALGYGLDQQRQSLQSQISAANGAITELIGMGLDATDSHVQEAVSQLQTLQALLDDLEARTKAQADAAAARAAYADQALKASGAIQQGGRGGTPPKALGVTSGLMQSLLALYGPLQGIIGKGGVQAAAHARERSFIADQLALREPSAPTPTDLPLLAPVRTTDGTVGLMPMGRQLHINPAASLRAAPAQQVSFAAAQAASQGTYGRTGQGGRGGDVAAGRLVEAQRKLSDALAEVNRRAAVFGDTQATMAERAGLVQGAIESLLAQGFDPESAAVQDLYAQYQDLTKAQADNTAGVKGAMQANQAFLDLQSRLLDATGKAPSRVDQFRRAIYELAAQGKLAGDEIARLLGLLHDMEQQDRVKVALDTAMIGEQVAQAVVDGIAAIREGDLKGAVSSLASAVGGVVSLIPGQQALGGFISSSGGFLGEIVQGLSDLFTGDSPAQRALRSALTDTVAGAFASGIMAGIRGEEGWQQALSDTVKQGLLSALIETFVQTAIVQTIMQPFIAEYVRILQTQGAGAAQAYLAQNAQGVIDQATRAAEGFCQRPTQRPVPQHAGGGRRHGRRVRVRQPVPAPQHRHQPVRGAVVGATDDQRRVRNPRRGSGHQVRGRRPTASSQAQRRAHGVRHRRPHRGCSVTAITPPAVPTAYTPPSLQLLDGAAGSVLYQAPLAAQPSIPYGLNVQPFTTYGSDLQAYRGDGRVVMGEHRYRLVVSSWGPAARKALLDALAATRAIKYGLWEQPAAVGARIDAEQPMGRPGGSYVVDVVVIPSDPATSDGTSAGVGIL